MRKIPLFCLVLFLLLKAVSAVSETHPEGLDWLNRSGITIGVPAGTNCGPEAEAAPD